MTNRLLVVGTAILLLIGQAFAQDEDKDFNERQAQKINKFAKKAYKKGFPKQAKLLWLQAIKLYSPDDAEAHKALGYVRMGSSWAPNSSFQYPTDDTGSGKDAASLASGYEKLKKDLANAHRLQANKWLRADRKDRANHHWAMVLRWEKDDLQAQQALQHIPVGGLTGTALEQVLYQNSKRIEKAVADQAKTDYEVELIEGDTQPFLEKAQVKYITVRSEHFTVRGDLPEPDLKAAAVWGERTLRILDQAFPTDKYPRDYSQLMLDSAHFLSKDTFKQVLKANASIVPNLEWTLENSTGSTLFSKEDGAMRVTAAGSSQVLNDSIVRQATKLYAGLKTAGFNEGIGHTFVGMIFNNNRLFAVDREKQEGTVASEEDRAYTSPDFDVWKELNLELAWKNTGGVQAVDIAFCDAASFTNQQRIKAWSFADYMMRRDPMLLISLDSMGAELYDGKRRRPAELAKMFSDEHGITLEQLDKEWEDFWTGASPVMQAILDDEPPLSAVSKDVQKWLNAFNEGRKVMRSTPVTWSATLSKRCKDHAEYLVANPDQRGAAAEQSQDPELGGTHLGSMFAQMAVVGTDAKIKTADDMFEKWLDWPGYRDALINRYILTVGIYVEEDILVMNVISGMGQPRLKKDYGLDGYPRPGTDRIPNSITVEELGPDLRELLDSNGHPELTEVGYPITLHLGNVISGDRRSFNCKVTDSKDNLIPGLIMLDGGENRRTSAPGMVTFYALQPLPRGPIEVVWTFDTGDGRQASLDSKFSCR